MRNTSIVAMTALRDGGTRLYVNKASKDGMEVIVTLSKVDLPDVNVDILKDILQGGGWTEEQLETRKALSKLPQDVVDAILSGMEVE